MTLHSRALLIGLLLSAGTVYSQESDLTTLSSWVAVDAPTGHEHLATEAIQRLYSGWGRDRTGNLYKTIGSGNPRTVVACALDSLAYAVSQITDDGYLRLHRIARGSRHPLWDQAHQGQHLRILTRAGPIIGVSAVANGHFAIQHQNETTIITQNDLWLDVGAQSAAEVSEMGIALLDPVIRNLPAWSYANEVAGPRVGARVGCAAVFAAAEAGINGSSGATKYVLSTQQAFGWVGLGSIIGDDARPDKLIIVSPGEAEFRNEEVSGVGARVDALLSLLTRTTIQQIAPKVSDADALMERIDLRDAQTLLTAVVEAVNPNAELPAWVSAPIQSPNLNADEARWGSSPNVNRYKEIEQVLDQLAEQSAVPGHEGPIRNIVYNALPEWAKEVTQIDDMGNLWVEFGPVSEATVFVAHTDEVGYEVESIEASGVVNLRRLGGVVSTAWEGQPALLQLDPFKGIESNPFSPQLRGVFLSRDNPQQKQPEAVQAWFGMNSETLAEVGVRIGMGITGYKEGNRMGPFRYASRSLDDRAGTAALLLAIQQIDPNTLVNRVIFAWSVQEEGGLRGAAELASKLHIGSRRVYSIDTFVSSDTPLESPHFAYAPLGDGPVLRSIENGGIVIPAELDRNKVIAANAGINVQIGLTQGTTDGTTFSIYGVPNAGLSWPGRYSHSPAEIADLRDVAELIDLIQAMAEAPLED